MIYLFMMLTYWKRLVKNRLLTYVDTTNIDEKKAFLKFKELKNNIW